MRFLFSLLVLAIPFAPALAVACEDKESLRLDELAKHVAVHVDSPAQLTIGSNAQVTLDWSISSRKVPDNAPTYFILSSSVPVRFLGTGFFALTKDAAGPSGISFGQQQSRAIVPLHNPTAEMQGSIRVQVLRAGGIELRWGLVAPTACGELIAGEEKSSLSASAVALNIVIQNPYDLQSPEKTIVSNDGRYRLHVFVERFRVFDAETGLLVVEAQGRQPNFSPTGRFLAAYQGGRDSRILGLFDLEAGSAIGTVTGPALIWQNGDSVVIS